MSVLAEMRLAAMMAEDAKAIAVATQHWREAINLGVAPPNKGAMRAGGIPARIVGYLRDAGEAETAEIAQALGLTRKQVTQAVNDLAKRGGVQRVGYGRYAAQMERVCP